MRFASAESESFFAPGLSALVSALVSALREPLQAKNLDQKLMKSNQEHLFDTVTFYQSTSYLLNNGYLRDF